MTPIPASNTDLVYSPIYEMYHPAVLSGIKIINTSVSGNVLCVGRLASVRPIC